jgi:hypothetical protein
MHLVLEGAEMGERPFRRHESLRAERLTWEIIPHFLRARGFTGICEERVQNGQTIYATSPDGEDLVLRTRVCWREDEIRGERPYAAAQLLATIKNNDPEGSLRAKVDRDAHRRITHLQLVQREHDRIVRAVLIPLAAALPLWVAERQAYNARIQQGRLGKRRANPVENGRSPTLYLEDEQAPEIAAMVEASPGVIDLARIEPVSPVGRGRGAGFDDPLQNQRVERAAVAVVTRRYLDAGWDVESVESAGCGYDLDCRRGDAVEHVEVKGIQGDMQDFFLTAGEFSRAREDLAFVLVVVTAALSEAPLVSTYSGSDFLEAFSFNPVQYRASLKKER